MRKLRESVSKTLLAALGISLIVAGIAQAQSDLPVFTGKFTLTTQVQWGQTILRPGDYTLTIPSFSGATIAWVRDGGGRTVACFMSGIDDRESGTGNALLIREKDGQLRLYALELGTVRRALVYDRALAREAVTEARAPQTVPIILTKR